MPSFHPLKKNCSVISWKTWPSLSQAKPAVGTNRLPQELIWNSRTRAFLTLFQSSRGQIGVTVRSRANLLRILQKAVIRVKQSQHGANVQPVLGICYGKTRTNYLRGYLKVVGQNFWYLISENEDLYTDIIEPIGYRAKEHNDAFDKEKAGVVNRFTKEFIDRLCDDTGAIDWVKLVGFNSGNYDLDKFLS